MSRTTAALEAAVATVIAGRAAERQPTARERARVDCAFARILRLIAPRIRHFIRHYGLAQHWDDAEQCCAIAVHRAIESYDPARAQFTTLVNWQIRGELQSLRFRLMTDQRPSARKVAATTVSLHGTAIGPEGEETELEALLVDEEALAATESAASAFLARSATECLVEEFVREGRAAALNQLRRQGSRRRPAKLRADEPRPVSASPGIDPDAIERIEQKFARDREILLGSVFGEADVDGGRGEPEITRERIRQVARRASKVMAELAASNPRFAVMADYAAGKRQPMAA